MGGYSLALLSLGVWWLVFFTRRKVRDQFASAQPEQSSSPTPQVFPLPPGSPLVAPLPTSTGRPLSITIVACWILVGCLSAPLGLLLRMPALLFTKILTGWPAAVYFIAFLALNLYIGIGLLRLKLTARPLAIAYYCFMFLSTATFYVVPGLHSRILDLMQGSEAMFPRMQPWQGGRSFLFDSTRFMLMTACLGLAGYLVPLYFLITRKDAYEKAAAQR